MKTNNVWFVTDFNNGEKKMNLIERIEKLETRIQEIEEYSDTKDIDDSLYDLDKQLQRLFDFIGFNDNESIKTDEPQITHYSENDPDDEEPGFVIKREDGKYLQRISSNSFNGIQKPYWTAWFTKAKKFETVKEASKLIKLNKIKKSVVE